MMDSDKEAVLKGLIDQLDITIFAAFTLLNNKELSDKELAAAGDTYRNLRSILLNVSKAVYWAKETCKTLTEHEIETFDRMLLDYRTAMSEGREWKYNVGQSTPKTMVTMGRPRVKRAQTGPLPLIVPSSDRLEIKE